MIKGRGNPPNNMLVRLRNKVKKIIRILDKQEELIQEIFKSTELQEMIIDLNTRDQLFEKGEDSLGRKLEDIGGGYAPYTISVKIEKGQPTDRVTLKDTGVFYDSFKVVVPSGADYIIIEANPYKEGVNINDEWGGHVIGLKSENLSKIKDYVHEKLLNIVRQKILAA
jgi:hypothetical protein